MTNPAPELTLALDGEGAPSPWPSYPAPNELERWLRVADDVAEQLAVDVVERDRAGEAPVAAAQLLRDSGLTNLVAPVEAGGHGAAWSTAFAVIRRIARVDASIAQILGYSLLNEACVAFYGPDARLASAWYRRSTAGGWLWSDSFNPVNPDLSLTHDGANYRLSGLKHFATGAAVADRVIAGANAQGGPYDGQFVVFSLDTTSDGIEHVDNWDHLGQRASASGSIRYTDVLVADDDLVGLDRETPFSSVVTPGVQLLFGNIYLGIAQGALEQAKQLTLARTNSWFLSGVDTYADDPVTHRVYGELVARTAAVEALADRANAQYNEAASRGPETTAAQRAEIEIAVAQLKVVSTEVSLEVAQRVYEVTGASSTKAAIGLDLHWRNIRTHSLHDPVDYKKIEVGAQFLTGAVQPVSLYT